MTTPEKDDIESILGNLRFAVKQAGPGGTVTLTSEAASKLLTEHAQRRPPMSHDLTPSEVALAKMLEAVEEWSKAAPDRRERGDAFRAVLRAAAMLPDDYLGHEGVPIDKGRTLIERAKKVGVLGEKASGPALTEQRDPVAVREGYCGALSARALACTRAPHASGDHVAEGRGVLEQWPAVDASRSTSLTVKDARRIAREVIDAKSAQGMSELRVCIAAHELACALGDRFGGPWSSATGPVTEEEARVYEDVRVERWAQDRKWGGPCHDDEHDPGDWQSYIKQHLQEADINPRSCKANNPTLYRRQMVRVAALAVAAIQSFDRRGSDITLSGVL